MIIDLRSDTVTRPTPGMLDAIMQAQTGDDVYKEDPTVNALEHKIASLFGMDDCAVFPNGKYGQPGRYKITHTALTAAYL